MALAHRPVERAASRNIKKALRKLAPAMPQGVLDDIGKGVAKGHIKGVDPSVLFASIPEATFSRRKGTPVMYKRLLLSNAISWANRLPKYTARVMPAAKFVARAGAGSTEHAIRLIQEGRVSINGEVVRSPTAPVMHPVDAVRVEGMHGGAPLQLHRPIVCLVYHKPRGIAVDTSPIGVASAARAAARARWDAMVDGARRALSGDAADAAEGADDAASDASEWETEHGDDWDGRELVLADGTGVTDANAVTAAGAPRLRAQSLPLPDMHHTSLDLDGGNRERDQERALYEANVDRWRTRKVMPRRPDYEFHLPPAAPSVPHADKTATLAAADAAAAASGASTNGDVYGSEEHVDTTGPMVNARFHASRSTERTTPATPTALSASWATDPHTSPADILGDDAFTMRSAHLDALTDAAARDAAFASDGPRDDGARDDDEWSSDRGGQYDLPLRRTHAAAPAAQGSPDGTNDITAATVDPLATARARLDRLRALQRAVAEGAAGARSSSPPAPPQAPSISAPLIGADGTIPPSIYDVVGGNAVDRTIFRHVSAPRAHPLSFAYEAHGKVAGAPQPLLDVPAARDIRQRLPAPWSLDAAIQPIGRLDTDSSGLVLFTSHNVLRGILYGPGSGVEKEFAVTLTPPPPPADLERLRGGGVDIGDATPSPPCLVFVRDVSDSSITVHLTFTELRPRLVQRIAAALGCVARETVLVRVGAIHLGGLAADATRMAEPEELAALGWVEERQTFAHAVVRGRARASLMQQRALARRALPLRPPLGFGQEFHLQAGSDAEREELRRISIQAPSASDLSRGRDVSADALARVAALRGAPVMALPPRQRNPDSKDDPSRETLPVGGGGARRGGGFRSIGPGGTGAGALAAGDRKRDGAARPKGPVPKAGGGAGGAGRGGGGAGRGGDGSAVRDEDKYAMVPVGPGDRMGDAPLDAQPIDWAHSELLATSRSFERAAHGATAKEHEYIAQSERETEMANNPSKDPVNLTGLAGTTPRELRGYVADAITKGFRFDGSWVPATERLALLKVAQEEGWMGPNTTLEKQLTYRINIGDLPQARSRENANWWWGTHTGKSGRGRVVWGPKAAHVKKKKIQAIVVGSSLVTHSEKNASGLPDTGSYKTYTRRATLKKPVEVIIRNGRVTYNANDPTYKSAMADGGFSFTEHLKNLSGITASKDDEGNALSFSYKSYNAKRPALSEYAKLRHLTTLAKRVGMRAAKRGPDGWKDFAEHFPVIAMYHKEIRMGLHPEGVDPTEWPDSYDGGVHGDRFHPTTHTFQYSPGAMAPGGTYWSLEGDGEGELLAVPPEMLSDASGPRAAAAKADALVRADATASYRNFDKEGNVALRRPLGLVDILNVDGALDGEPSETSVVTGDEIKRGYDGGVSDDVLRQWSDADAADAVNSDADVELVAVRTDNRDGGFTVYSGGASDSFKVVGTGDYPTGHHARRELRAMQRGSAGDYVLNVPVLRDAPAAAAESGTARPGSADADAPTADAPKRTKRVSIRKRLLASVSKEAAVLRYTRVMANDTPVPAHTTPSPASEVQPCALQGDSEVHHPSTDTDATGAFTSTARTLDARKRGAGRLDRLVLRSLSTPVAPFTRGGIAVGGVADPGYARVPTTPATPTDGIDAWDLDSPAAADAVPPAARRGLTPRSEDGPAPASKPPRLRGAALRAKVRAAAVAAAKVTSTPPLATLAQSGRDARPAPPQPPRQAGGLWAGLPTANLFGEAK